MNSGQARPSQAPRTLAVLEWNRYGHHQAYLRLYVRALLGLGFRLAVLAHGADDVRVWVRELPEEWRRRLVLRELPRSDFSLRSTRWNQAWRRWRHGRGVARLLASAEAELGARCEQVFFSCIYEFETSLIGLLADRLRRPWAGLYLHASAYRQPGRPVEGANRAYPIRRLWGRPGFFGLLVLDEEMAPVIASETGTRVMAAPDLADPERGGDAALLARVRAFRAGRPLIGSSGHLLPSKGVAVLAEAALAPGASGLAFLFAGEVAWARFSPAEAEVLRRAAAGGERVLFLDQRIPDEATYNDLVAECDVLVAAYRDFPHSSNTLAKAALFEKPVVVSDGHLMAKRVREYRLGAVVPQDDPARLLESVRALAEDPRGWAEVHGPRWREYREAHSEVRLAEALRELLGPA